MTTYTGTQDVEPGLYLNLKRFTVKSIEARGPLPGATEETYCRVPMLLMLAAAPLIGLTFVIFLPFIGFAMVAYLLGQKAVEVTANAAGELGRVARPGWAPSLAFLSRFTPKRKRNTSHTTNDKRDAWAENVEKKLNETDRDAR